MKQILSLWLLAVLICTAFTGCFRPAAAPSSVTPDTSVQTDAPDTDSETDQAGDPVTDPVTEPETEPETTVPETEPLTPETEEEAIAETDPPASETVPPEETDTPDPDAHDIAVIDGVTYIDGVLIVNKTYALPETYAVMRDDAAFAALCRMFSDAKTAGVPLKVASGYRSYYDQRYIYNGYVAANGQAAADRFSARPGHSEHQSGLAYDVDNPDSNSLLQSFGNTPAGIWLAENCHKYGFIIRYPQGKEHLTGYMYEPWHVRYLGVELATEVYESGLCLEEFFGITSAYAE